MNSIRYFCNQKKFFVLSGQPIAYWASQKTIDCFSNSDLLANYVTPSVGIQPVFPEKYVHYWWEVAFATISFSAEKASDSFTSQKWFPYNKGGSFRKWFGNDEMVIDWQDDGLHIKEDSQMSGHHYQQYSDSLKFKPLVTWSRICTGMPAFRYKRSGYLSDMAGFSLYAPEEYLVPIMAYCNSSVACHFLSFLAPTLNIMVGQVLSLPFDSACLKNQAVMESATNCIEFEKRDWDAFETSWNFVRHPLVGGKHMGYLISALFDEWAATCSKRFLEVKQNEEKINAIYIDQYNLSGELSPCVSDDDVSIRKADLNRESKSLLSYFVGLTMGRYSLDSDGLVYAGGKWDLNRYVSYKPNTNGIEVLNNDFFGDESLDNKCISLLRTIYGADTFEKNISFISDALGGKGSPRDTISSYFLNDFYQDHLKIYQKRPIYWLFDAGKKNSFKALVYIHRYSPDTLATLRTDYILPLLDRYNSRIDFLAKELPTLSGNEANKITKELEKLKGQFQELSEYEPKIHHLADQHIALNLDDGVKANYEKLSDVLASLK
jgi:hypothetical protein